MNNGISFNLNSKIKVKLKPEGYTFWKEYNDRFLPDRLKKPIYDYIGRADSKGYVSFQAWDFMEIFGQKLILGTIPPFSLEILIYPQNETIKMQTPQLVEKDGEHYLADQHGQPKVFTTRYSALATVVALKAQGHDAALCPGSVFYRIVVNVKETVEA